MVAPSWAKQDEAEAKLVSFEATEIDDFWLE